MEQDSEVVFESKFKSFLTSVNGVIEEQLTSGCSSFVD
jgi:hypothetical protein